MLEQKKPRNWKELYWNQIKRNIGFISFSDQETLRVCQIAIFGLGGLGGPIAEQLVRAGCENIIICDNDKYEESNLNRQLCTREDLGQYKVDVINQYFKKINPELDLYKYYDVNENNISQILKNVKVAVLTLDDPIASIIISRECYKKKIPMIESWAFPYICAWWFTENNVEYENCYGLNTTSMNIKQIKESEIIKKNIKESLIMKILQFPGLQESCDREPGVVNAMRSGAIPLRSFAPIVRISASYLTFEIIFAGILKIKKMILAPKIIGYDYLRMKLIKFNFI